ncbi:MAG TPA: hypothetical protein VF646_10375, partial [Cytophagales bacterium]
AKTSLSPLNPVRPAGVLKSVSHVQVVSRKGAKKRKDCKEKIKRAQGGGNLGLRPLRFFA